MSKEKINLKMSDAELQAFLNKKNGSKRLCIVLIVIFALATLLGFMSAVFPLAIAGVASLLVTIVILSRITKQMKHSVSENVVRSVIESVFDEVYYDPFGRLADGII